MPSHLLFQDRHWFRMYRFYIIMLISLVAMVGLGAVVHFESTPPLAILADAELTIPVSQQALDGNWDFLPDAEADTRLKPVAPALPQLNWAEATTVDVPSNWYVAGQDISGVAWYRCTFQVDDQFTSQDLTLIFNGVDYAADVWLNDQYLGFHEGYFQTFQFFVSDMVNVGQENELIVRVNSPLEQAPQDWSLHKRLIKGVLAHHDARPGGAWSDRGQEKNTGGIWAPVMLRASQDLVINQVKVTPQVSSNDEQAIANVAIDVTVPTQESHLVQIKAQLLPANFEANPGHVFGTTQTLTTGKNAIQLEIPQSDPQLWWTWDHGQPNLYTLRLQFLEGDRLLDAWETRFGFRTVEWDKRAQIFRLNGHRIFLRGTNYIPSQWLSELAPEQIAQDLELMQDAHINSVRVHAHVTTPTFYQQADQEGMLIWQDFPLQWGYEDTEPFISEAVHQGKEMIDQLYNHPSIFTWSLHNEPPWDAFWMADKYSSYDPEQNRRLDKVLYQSLKSRDQTRYLHPASVIGEHPWWGWYSLTYSRYGEPTDQPLITEYGAQALPNHSSLARMFESDNLWPETETDWAEWRYRNFQPHETFELAQVDQGNTLEEFIANTQDYQARLHQYAAEAYRRQRFRPVSAIFQFMFCEPWSSISWGMVDYWREPKPGYGALQQAYQPILPSIEATADSQVVGQSIPIKLWVINDSWEPLSNTTLRYRVQKGEQILDMETIPFELWGDDLKLLKTVKVTPEEVGDYVIIAEILKSDDHPISRNQYTLKVISQS